MAGKGRVFGSLAEEDILMASEEGRPRKDVKAGGGEEEEEDPKGKGKLDVDAETAKGMSKGMLVAFFVAALALPGVVLIAHSFLLRSGVDEEHTSCYVRCRTAFVQQDRIFKTDYHPELECQAYCDDRQIRASSQADAVFLGGLILIGGCIFGLGLIHSLEGILEGFSRKNFVPRAAYKEPMYTEEEMRRQARVVGNRERAFWEFVRHPVFDCQTQEVMCRDCNVPVEVDTRWLTGDRGGMSGARCPRCLRTIVGVL